MAINASTIAASYSEFFLGMPVDISAVYLCGTEEHPILLGALLERFFNFRVSRLT